ncbi:MAG: hypothetical protein Q7T11_10030 [Deltaproteobacteria bacterium]|nr:hypothetical protein [Deltaproteobacteria bacterium]
MAPKLVAEIERNLTWPEPSPEATQFLAPFGFDASSLPSLTLAQLRGMRTKIKKSFSPADTRLIWSGLVSYGILRDQPLPSSLWLSKHTKSRERIDIETAELARLRLELYAGGVRFPLGSTRWKHYPMRGDFGINQHGH